MRTGRLPSLIVTFLDFRRGAIYCASAATSVGSSSEGGRNKKDKINDVINRPVNPTRAAVMTAVPAST